MLTQWFEPELVFKGLLFAKELRKLGHDVQVLTSFPNYPGVKLYNKYTIKLFQREIMGKNLFIFYLTYIIFKGSL